MKIEDYALLGNSMTAALVGKDGSIDWLCLPQFDSPSCFSALLGTSDHGRWKIAPATDEGRSFRMRRRYLPGTLVLETEFLSEDGAVARLVDLLIPGISTPVLVRVIEGVRGTMTLDMDLVIRFDYGSMVPWVRKQDHGMPEGIVAIAGPDTVRVYSPVPMHGENYRTRARFEVRAGKRIPFALEWHPSHEKPCLHGRAAIADPQKAIRQATHWWRSWSAQTAFETGWNEPVERSLITLKALTHAATGGIVAAPTTSLPECPGGVRNWDYRLCWLRDSTFTLRALTGAGYYDEARAWRDWLLRAIAGNPADISILYGIRGERRLTEYNVPWLPGYENSKPVRIGNDAFRQLQLDVFGQVMDSFDPQDDFRDWRVRQKLVEYLETVWRLPDCGIWEIRGEPRHFTHSKVMAWVAFDRAIRTLERSRQEGPLERWRDVRDRLRAEILQRGFNSERGAFTQSYGSRELDASTLMIPLVGFLPATDPRMRATIHAIQSELTQDGFVLRYRTHRRKDSPRVDGLPEGEGAFLACSFWLADNLHLLGETRSALELYERVLSVRNDVGLLAEEYDPHARRQLGNFPQAFSHLALINTAMRLGVAKSSNKPMQYFAFYEQKA